MRVYCVFIRHGQGCEMLEIVPPTLLRRDDTFRTIMALGVCPYRAELEITKVGAMDGALPGVDDEGRAYTARASSVGGCQKFGYGDCIDAVTREYPW